MSIENSIGKLKIIPLLEANQDALGEFTNRVQKRRGRIPVLTHPFFREDWPADHPCFPRLPQYCQSRDHFIAACLNHNVPLVVFEQESEIDLLPQRISTPGTLYLVVTGNNGILPKELEAVKPFPKKRLIEPTKEWQQLEQILHHSGVRYIQVGGQYLMIFTGMVIESGREGTSLCQPIAYLSDIFQWKDPRKLSNTTGCVGQLARIFLSRGFRVSLSPISSPRKAV